MSTDTADGGITSDVDRMAEFAATVPEGDYGELWSLLDWSFWGAGMGDVLREPLATAMIAAIPADIRALAEKVMADFIERRKIEKTGVTIYQEQKAEVDRLREELESFRPQPMSQLCRDGKHNGVGDWACINCWCLCHAQDALIARLRDELAEMTGHRDAYIRDRDRHRAEIARLREETERLTAMVDGLQDAGVAVEAERDRAHNLAEAWAKRADSAAAENDRLRERLDAAEPDDRHVLAVLGVAGIETCTYCGHSYGGRATDEEIERHLAEPHPGDQGVEVPAHG